MAEDSSCLPAGKAFVIAEHQLYFLRELVDQVIYMKDGETSEIFDAKELKQMDNEKLAAKGLRPLYMDELRYDIADISQGRITALVGHNGAGKRPGKGAVSTKSIKYKTAFKCFCLIGAKWIAAVFCIGGYTLRIWGHATATTFSHVAAYHSLGQIRLQMTRKLTKARLGSVFLELPLAHVIPKELSNLALTIWLKIRR